MLSKRLFILLLLSVTITTAQGANLLTNGNFNTGDLTGWTVELANQNDIAEVNTTVMYDGTPSLFLQSRSGIWEGALVYQEIDVNGLATVDFSCVANKFGGWGDFRVDLAWYSGPYDPCDPNINFVEWEEWIVIENADETTDWESFSNTFTVPDGAVNVIFGLRANDWVWNVYVDDVFFGTPVTDQAILVSPVRGGWVPEEDKSNCGFGPTLQWEAAPDATGNHHVYFGTTFEDVDDANENDPEHKDSVSLATTSYTLALDDVDKGQPYYWRVDETVDGNVVKAQDVWQFSVWNLTWLDRFDSYITDANIQAVWGPNAAESDWTMQINYNGSNYEVSADTADLLCSPDISENAMLVLEVKGHDNMSDNVYVKLESNGGTESGVVQLPAVQLNQQAYEPFITWPIDLQEFASQGVDLTNVTKITIGVGTGSGPSGSGTVYIDNICLDYPYCIAELIPADFDNNCWVGMQELEMLANDWLASSYIVTANTPSQDPILWYKFDEGDGIDPLDYSVNGYHGWISDLYAWAGPGTGHDGTDCVNLGNAEWVQIPVAVNNDHNTIGAESTVSFWLKDPGQTDQDSMIVQIGVDGRSINMWTGATGSFFYKAGYDPDTGFRDELNIGSMDYTNPDHPQDQWVHYAFVKSYSNGYTRAYRNGELIAEVIATVSETPILDEVEGYATLGAWRWSGGVGGYYDGLIDDFRIYDYALSHEEVLKLAVDGGAATSPLTQGLIIPSDATGDDIVNFYDLAKMAEFWLQTVVWP